MEEIKKQKLRSEIDDKYKWHLDKIYASDENWDEDFKTLKLNAPSLKEFQGRLKDGKTIYEFLKKSEKYTRLAEKLMMYAYLKYYEDTSNAKYQALKTKIDIYLAEFNSYVAFFEPEILSLDKDVLLKIVEDTEELHEYRFTFATLLSQKEHVLPKEIEEVLALASDSMQAPENIRGMLADADMKFPVVEGENGAKIQLTEENYSSLIKSKDQKVREGAFKALFGQYKNLENTFATALVSSVKNFIFNSKVRHYKSSLESSMQPNNIPTEVYTNAVKTINDNLHLLHRYVALKKKMLGLNEIHMYDLYVPVTDFKSEHIEFEEAVEIVKKGLKPLGSEYLDIFSDGIDQGWVDVFENKGKRGGAFSWGSYDTMPYVLLNYNYELNDVSTLAHEMGHSLHSYYSRKEQPYQYHDYSLFLAEVASTTNEILLINYLIDNADDKARKLFLVNQQLEQIRTTVFRQLMFAEFELVVHEEIEKGEALTAEDFNKIWHDLNVKYFGDDIVVDKEIDSEWARIPHFFSDFYVYQYATGYSAANAFANSILEKGSEAVEKYKGFLKAGSSDYPIKVLQKAGVDMLTPKPIEATMHTFEHLLDVLEETIK